MGSPRLLLLLLSTAVVMTSAIGYVPRNDDGPTIPRGDWPDRFPQHPPGFSYKCKERDVRTTKKTVATTTPPVTVNDGGDGGGKVTETTTTQYPITTTQILPSTTTEVAPVTTAEDTTTTTAPTTTQTRVTITEILTSTTVKVTDVPTTTQEPTTTHEPITTTHILTSTTAVPVTTMTTTQKPTTTLTVTEQPQTETTFWIRSPTSPNAPEPVNPGSGTVKLGDPLLVTVAIDDPFTPDAALDPLNPGDRSDDFDIETVGTPKPPRAVVDPDE